jgi:hypothetical protein
MGKPAAESQVHAVVASLARTLGVRKEHPRLSNRSPCLLKTTFIPLLSSSCLLLQDPDKPLHNVAIMKQGRARFAEP